MTVTVNAALVASFSGDITRPGYAGAVNQGWNNRVGDPTWTPDYDWYRRVQLSLNATVEDTRIVNWELYDDTVPFKTAGDITTATAGAVASPYGAVINHSVTWTVWATTGVATAAAPKYYDTKVAAFSKLRANGQRVQVELGPRKALSTKGGLPTTWTIAAFLPGAGKLPTATGSIVIAPPTPTQQPVGSPYSVGAGEDEVGLRQAEARDEEEKRVEAEAKKSGKKAPVAGQLPVIQDEEKPPKEDKPEKVDKPPKKPEPKGKN